MADPMADLPNDPARSVAVVIPVYRGEKTIGGIVSELLPLTVDQATPGGNSFRVTEIILVHDVGPDRSDLVMEQLSQDYPFVHVIWLSRNFGQHPATLAGLSSTSADWVVTMDEDGQHDPRDIPKLLDVAIESGAQVVYASPTNPPPHGLLRNAASAAAKRLFVSTLDGGNANRFHSFRIISGEIARSLAAYCGSNVYLDVALSWLVGRTSTAPVRMRSEGKERMSGYNFSRLFAHFWRMVLTSGTRPLRIIAMLGTFSMVIALALSGYALWEKFTQRVPIMGWTSMVIATSFFSGAILFSLGIIAEYLGSAVNMAMGKPVYVTVSKPVRFRT